MHHFNNAWAIHTAKSPMLIGVAFSNSFGKWSRLLYYFRSLSLFQVVCSSWFTVLQNIIGYAVQGAI